MARQADEDQPARQHPASNSSTTGHEHLIRRNHSEVSERENDISYRARPRPRTHHYAMERPPEQEVSRPRPRSFYENPAVGRDFRDQRNVVDPREVRVIDFSSLCSDVLQGPSYRTPVRVGIIVKTPLGILTGRRYLGTNDPLSLEPKPRHFLTFRILLLALAILEQLSIAPIATDVILQKNCRIVEFRSFFPKTQTSPFCDVPKFSLRFSCSRIAFSRAHC